MLHEITKNIYLKTLKLFGIQVLSNSGFQDIISINMTEKSKQYLIKAGNYKLKCSGKHILIDKNMSEIYAKDSFGHFILTEDGLFHKVVEVKELQEYDNLYDLSLDEKSDHLYFANGLLSHNCIICDEFAFLQKNLADKLFTSMYPTISSSKNGKFIIVSTPNGTGNLYYDIWCQANSKEVGKNLDGWKAFTMYWWQVPGHDEAWKEKQIAAIGKERFAQEFNNEFISSSATKKLIPDDIIEKYRIKLSEYKALNILPKNQKIISQDEKELFEFEMWHEFKPKHTYLASMDISEGVGGDSSVLYIWDVTDLSNIIMCARFSSNTVSLVQFAYISRKILALYNDPILAAERNGVSAGTLDSLKITYGYQNIAVENKKNEVGIYSHVTIKTKACIWAKEMMTTSGFGFTIYDKELIDEMSIFCKKDTKGQHLVFQALPGPNSHDDHMMAFIWGLYLLQNDLINSYFIVCQSFTSELDQIYARLLQPINEITGEQWKKITNDPMYKDFIEYKSDIENKLKKYGKLEEQDDQNDIFKYKQTMNKFDEYFGDVLDDSNSWNNVMTIYKQNDNLDRMINLGSNIPTYCID